MNGTDSLSRRHRDVLQRIAAAARAAGRSPESVRLLAVSKTFAAPQVAELAAVGQVAFGENYLQEAVDKIAELAQRPILADERPADGNGRSPATGTTSPGHALEWHFIGPIQSNKTRKIAQTFDWVQSVDSLRIAQRLSDQRPPERGPLNLCLQVNVSGEATKGGCPPDQAVPLALAIAALPNLVLRGVMAIPEATDDVLLQRRRFAAVRAVGESIREALPKPLASRFDTMSMGMSADLETAIAEGSTMVRVGSALFGRRVNRDARPDPGRAEV